MTVCDCFLFCLGQKISPDGKAKIQLQLVRHTGESTTFHFSNDSSALKDREAAKELLQQLLPKFKKKANKELEEKNRWGSKLGFQGCFKMIWSLKGGVWLYFVFFNKRM